MDYFSTEKLIDEVEKRKALYDKTQPTYGDRIAKEELWDQVSQAIVSGWRELPPDEKIANGKSEITRIL